MAKKISKKNQNTVLENRNADTKKLINNYLLNPVAVECNTDGGVVVVNLKQSLSASDWADFVNDGAESLFSLVDDSVVYLSFLYDFTFKFQVLKYLTDVEIPQDTTESWKLIMETKFYDQMLGLLPFELMIKLQKSFDEAVEYRKKMVFSEENQRLEKMRLQIQEYIDVISIFSGKLEGVGAQDYMDNINKLVDMMGKQGEGTAAKLVSDGLKVVN